jgi:peptide chain release factor 3
MLEPSPYTRARWIICDDKERLKAFVDAEKASICLDRDGNNVYFAKGEWELDFIRRQWPEIGFASTRERG